MIKNIDINDINKVRSQALRWAKRTENCKWESLPFLCMRIGRCMRRLGFDYSVYEITTLQGVDTVQFALYYTVDKPKVIYLITEFLDFELDDKGNFASLGKAAQCIVECCQQLADYIYERPTPQPLP